MAAGFRGGSLISCLQGANACELSSIDYQCQFLIW